MSQLRSTRRRTGRGTLPTILWCPRCGAPLPMLLSDFLRRPGLPVPTHLQLVARCPRRDGHDG